MIDALAALLPALSPLPYLAHPEVLVSALLALLKKEPVRVASFALAAVLILVATLTGVSLPVLLAEIGAAVVTLEKVRAVVAPMVDVIVHADDVPPGSVPVFLDLPQVAAPSPSSNVSVVDAPPSTDDVETLGGDL